MIADPNQSTTTINDKLTALILKEMERQGIKATNISKETGIPKWNLSRYLHGQREMDMDTLIIILQSLQCSLQIRNNKTGEIINVE